MRDAPTVYCKSKTCLQTQPKHLLAMSVFVSLESGYKG